MRHCSTNLRVNDKVEVITGKDKGRVGKILKIDREKNKVLVERINLIKKHQKAKDASQTGQIIERESSINLSNVMLVCPECAETVRIGKKVLEDGTKVRICKKCQATIESTK
ncbi:LSU ribosomal protein L24P [Desulfobulbus propionicus DSM 2032]|jgi:large subunit ribosomal protein L24|uniref:Large ribosomal subunit protein uL24 n=1 Tax=Desulfobulbus propionicus (strain ATCC 33891 / DSM 2032 / VKM B-1956 / 1pr3) TaxID=577650 RepID=A0A7U4DNF1_DESPD|nr:50S ribosomal protein L24 [Desulfobulbus propionicus]ADW16974.1 LSU ribosomal protein L24P [Desulfobulbus propionicus DSM 2032]